MEAWDTEVDNPRALFIEAMTACASEITPRVAQAPEEAVVEAQPTGRLGLVAWQVSSGSGHDRADHAPFWAKRHP